MKMKLTGFLYGLCGWGGAVARWEVSQLSLSSGPRTGSNYSIYSVLEHIMYCLPNPHHSQFVVLGQPQCCVLQARNARTLLRAYRERQIKPTDLLALKVEIIMVGAQSRS